MTEKCCRCERWTFDTIDLEHMPRIREEISLRGPICTDCIWELFADLGQNEWDNMIWNLFQDIAEMQKVHEGEVRNLETERDELLIQVEDLNQRLEELEDELSDRPEPEEANYSMPQEFFST